MILGSSKKTKSGDKLFYVFVEHHAQPLYTTTHLFSLKKEASLKNWKKNHYISSIHDFLQKAGLSLIPL